MIQWHMQEGNINTNLKVKTNFILPEFSATEIMIWDFNVDDPSKGRYDMILSRNILAEL